MDIAVIGLGHAFSKQYDALKKMKEVDRILLCDNDVSKREVYGAIGDYRDIDVNNVIVATSPISHLEIVKYLLNSDKKVILEKPVVTNLLELRQLMEVINIKNFYNALHFSFGKEIDYYMQYKDNIPLRIEIYISDNYVRDGHVIKEAVNLGGSYLDEVINPLSACYRLFGGDIKFIDVTKKKYDSDRVDYYSYSRFDLGGIPTNVEVIWNNKESEKYIDLYYESKVIRLDSMCQQVRDLTNDILLFSGDGDRMTNHYIGVFRDYFDNGSNLETSMKLHEEILKGV